MNTFRKVLIMFVVVSVALAVAFVAAPVQPASAEAPYDQSDAGIMPVYHAGNTMSKLGYMDYKIEWEDLNQPGYKKFEGGTLPAGAYIEVTIGEKDVPTYGVKDYVVTWTASGIEVYFVDVKGGDGYNEYVYVSPMMTDGNLWPPLNNGGQISGISHITFYFMVPEETTTEPEETTTEPLESTVTETTIELTTESIPLTSPTTTEPEETTMTEMTTTETMITLTTESIPQTGEGGSQGSGNGLLIGIILLVMAGGLTYVVYRNRPVKQ